MINQDTLKPHLSRLYLLILLISIIFWAGSLCHATPDKLSSTIRVATLENFPPQYSLTDQGEPAGFAIAIMDQVAELAGLTPEYIIYPNWKQAQQALKNGTVDAIPNMGITQRRKNFAEFTDPVETFPVSIFTRDAEHNIKSLQDLSGRKVAVMKLNVGYILLKDKKDIELVFANTISEAIMLLLSGKADALVFPRPVIEMLARQSRLSDRLKVVGRPLKEISRGIAVAKGNFALQDKLNQAVREFVTTSQYKRIYSQWYGKADPFWTTPRLLIGTGIIIALFIGTLVFMRYQNLTNFNKELEWRVQERTEQLEISERNTQLLFEKSFLGIAEHKLVYDYTGQATDYIITNVNPAYYTIFDYEKGSVEGRKASEVYGIGEAPFLKEFLAAIKNDQPQKIELEFVPMQKTFKVFVYSHKPDCFVTLFENITERKENERKAEEQKKFIKSLLSAIPIPVFYKDRHGHYMGCNTAFTEMIGPTSEEIAGKTVFDLAPRDIAEIYHQRDLELMENPEHQRYEAIVVTKFGEERSVLFAKDVFYDQHGNSMGLIGAFMDITDRREVEKALEKSKEKYRRLFTELSRAHEELNQFAYVVSHDLKSPLRAISNYATFINEDMADQELPDQVSGHLKGLNKAVAQCVELVDDLLELSQIGRTNTERIEVDVKSMLFEIVEGLKLPHNSTVSIADEIPSVTANPIMLRQIFTNLITNGIKFNTSAEKNIEVSGWSLSDAHVEIMVRDDGIGIDGQYHQQIFKVFQRLHTKNEYEGTGVGLAIVKKCVEVMDGSIRLESTPGQGSVFFITLPATHGKII